MSERVEKRKRYNQRLQYIAEVQKWLSREPSMLRVISWHRWKRQRPVWMGGDLDE